VIGRILDKYEILEEVGQGGMAVVYRGRDRVLQRDVAVKVLHPHLASAPEARLRFEREAHAVAKLRHENILEIFDYSGTESADSYIVTEFINGTTLKGALGEHEPGFPEIGAMIVVEVLRALAHAHSLGVLHRDVKPENVMIRDDGVLKLMDFGIAQIVDAQRMTVTGQLLGSPAYMSPEHVEGRPLDFRTDVFAAGILLYQLSTNELPFKGKNPHEILKRIADCRYVDARVVNPLVGDRLNRIIARALAREPDDRFPDVTSMLDELLRVLAEVDLSDPRGELKRYFADPVAYEGALRQRLLSVLARRARAELAARRTSSALEVMNRVLTIDPANEEVLGLLDSVERRRRLWKIGVLAVAGFALAGMATAAAHIVNQHEPVPPPSAGEPATVRPAAIVAPAPAPAPKPPAQPPPVVVESTRPPRERPEPTKARHEEAHAAVPATRTFVLLPKPFRTQYSVDGGELQTVHLDRATIEVGPGGHVIHLRHDLCNDEEVPIRADEDGHPIQVRLPFKSALLTARCAGAQVISVDGRATDSGTPLPIVDFKSSRKQVVVEFVVDGKIQKKTVDVVPGKPHEVKCDAD
jgi:serine/threonine-protein kinase